MRPRNLHWHFRSRRSIAAAVAVLVAGGVTVAGASLTTATADEPEGRAEQFSAAAAEFNVPEEVLLGVSYMESRWQDHGGKYSSSGGFGPMHLTDVNYVKDAEGKSDKHYEDEDPRGDASRPMKVGQSSSSLDTDKLENAAAYQNLSTAAKLTKVSKKQLRTDPAQNIRGGAAVLASYQDKLGNGTSDDPFSWYGAVAKYAGSSETESAKQFADFVYEVIESGTSAQTDDGKVSLEATAGSPKSGQLDGSGLKSQSKNKKKPNCPKKLDCEWVPAPYEQYGDKPEDYGNYDKANRPKDMDIDYIVVHDTETSYSNALDLVKDPEYISWQYTMRSFDGHVAQHLDPKDVGWQAGNWSINSHSLGVEHEGVAAEGSWFTEAMYASSAKLIKYLAKQNDIPLDRAHILGHENVPGTAPDTVAGMHWDPGPYWDWEHYFDLMGADVDAADSDSKLVTVAPSYKDNTQEFTGCDVANPDASCGERSASTLFVHSKPDEKSDLLNDPGMDDSGKPATKRINDVGSRVNYGQKFSVAEVDGDWTAIWYLGQKGWVHNPADKPVLVPAKGKTATPKKADTPVYGVAYPEADAYEGTGVPVEKITPLPYKLGKDQAYSVAGKVKSQYFNVKEFKKPGTVVNGDRTYYQVQVGGRAMYVDSADVDVS